MPRNLCDAHPEVAFESDVPEFTRAIVNRRLEVMGSSIRIGGDVELSRDTLDYAAREVSNELWGIIVRAMREAHPELDIGR
jgi:hypothetical protein